MKSNNIQKTYFDALFYASSTDTTKQEFHIDCVQFKLMLKLIHYDAKENYITWQSENISKHISIPIGSIDKAIQRLNKKGYIKVVIKQIDYTHKKRTITINWEKLSEIDELYQNSILNETIINQPELEELLEEKMVEEIITEEIITKEIPELNEKQLILLQKYKNTNEKVVEGVVEGETIEEDKISLPKDIIEEYKSSTSFLAKQMLINKYPTLILEVEKETLHLQNEK
jgi:DNA-binding MarR family transcriptional regulator